jgi:hypothetical protein
MMEGKTNKQVVKEFSNKFGIEIGKFDPGIRIDPLPEDILQRFFEEESESQHIISYARRYLQDHGGRTDAVNKVSRLYKKLDRLLEDGDSEGVHEVMSDMIALMIEGGKR